MTHNPIVPLPARGRTCPICGKPASPRQRPFCSQRCTDIDLGRWLKGNYRVETEEGPDDPTGESREE
jgi:endogenous inhibitor of DNA gyrase (YacG/DUF329 family)